MRKKIIVILIALLLTSVSAAGLLFYFLGNDDSAPYIATIDNERIYLDEFYVYLYEYANKFEQTGGADIWDMSFDGESADNVAKQGALDSIAFIKTSVKQAEKRGMSLDETETAEAAAWADQVYERLGGEYAVKLDIDIASLRKIMMENDLYTKLFDKLTENYEISEDEFDIFYKEYYEQNRKSLERITVQYLLCVKGEYSQENASYIRDIALNGTKLEDIISILPRNLPGFENIKYGIATANEGLIHAEAVEAAYQITPGEISQVIKTSSGGYYVMQVLDIMLPDEDELRVYLREEYVSQKKMELYRNEYTKWSAEVKINKNYKVWNDVSVSDLF